MESMRRRMDDETPIYIGGYYMHFKFGLYKVITLASDSETLRQMVVYRGMKSGTTWVRPLDEFVEILDREKYPDANQRRRFEYLTGGGVQWIQLT